MKNQKYEIGLGLLCRKKDYTRDSETRIRSGHWDIHEKHRGHLMGKNVVLTSGQKQPAYIGGKIIGFNPTRGNRVEVIFIENKHLEGNSTTVSHSKWGNEKCYIYNS